MQCHGSLILLCWKGLEILVINVSRKEGARLVGVVTDLICDIAGTTATKYE